MFDESTLRKLKDHRYFTSGQYSDLTIVSGMREFKVHKVVVCGRSEWFEKAMKEDAFMVTSSVAFVKTDLLIVF